jgi:hypothetical protein
MSHINIFEVGAESDDNIIELALARKRASYLLIEARIINVELIVDGVCRQSGEGQIGLIDNASFLLLYLGAKFVFIAVEKKPPYALNILEADEIFIRKGYDDFRTYLGMLKYCRETDNWYSYTGETGRPNVLNLPAWLIKEYE